MKKFIFIAAFLFILCSTLTFATDLTTADVYASFDGDGYLDESGNSVTATNTGTVDITGKINEARYYGGDGDKIVYATKPVGDHSISLWFYPQADTTSALMGIVTTTGGTGRDGFFLGIGAGTIQYNNYIGNSASGYCLDTQSFSQNTWYHVVIVADSGNNPKLYLNGNLLDCNSGVQSLSVGTSDFDYTLGHYYESYGSRYWDGKIDEFAVYHGDLLTQTDVDALYNSGSGYNPYSPASSNFTITAKTYSGQQLLVYNATVNGTNYQTTDGTIVTNISSDSGNFNVDIAAFDSLSNFSTTISNWNTANTLLFNYSILRVDAENARTSVAINNFNISAITGQFNQTTTGTTDFFVNTGTLNATVSSLGYAPDNRLVSIAADGLNTQTFSLYAENSVLVNIYNATTGLKITSQSVNVYFLDGETTENSGTTSTGEYFASGLNATTYTVRLESNGFQTTEYTVTVGENSFQTLNVYMSQNSENQEIFTIKNRNTGAIIEDATVSVQKFINGSYILVASLTSDISGRVSFYYDENIKYRFTISASGYQTRTFELNPIIFSSYNIWLTPLVSVEPTNNDKFSLYFEPTEYVNNANNSIEYFFTSPGGYFEVFGFNATYDTTTVANESLNAYGARLTQNLEITGASVGDRVKVIYYYQLTNGTMQIETHYFTITGLNTSGGTWDNVNDDYDLGLFERVLIITVIVFLVSGAAFVFGGITASGLIAEFILGYFIKTGFLGTLTPFLLIPPMIFIFLIVAWRYS